MSCSSNNVNYTKPGARREWTGNGLNLIQKPLPGMKDWWMGVMNPAPEGKECFEPSRVEYRGGFQSRYNRK